MCTRVCMCLCEHTYERCVVSRLGLHAPHWVGAPGGKNPQLGILRVTAPLPPSPPYPEAVPPARPQMPAVTKKGLRPGPGQRPAQPHVAGSPLGLAAHSGVKGRYRQALGTHVFSED